MSEGAPFDNFTFAFQPIVDIEAGGRPYAYEALVRGKNGESAHQVLSAVPDEDMLAFDAACRKKAVEMAAFFSIRSRLSLNISASAICDHRFGLHSTLQVAKRVGWPPERLIFEMTEHAPVKDAAKLSRWIAAARNRGATVALDDFGTGYATIDNLLRLRPGMIKLDRQLICGIDTDMTRQAFVRGIVEACKTFNCTVVAEGVESHGECQMLSTQGIHLMQGYLFAAPALESLPVPSTHFLNLVGTRIS